MKTTVELPDELLQQAKATAALRGESLNDLMSAAIRLHLGRQPGAAVSSHRGWRSVFGKARQEQIEAIDAVVAEELERIDPGDWR